MTTNNSSNASNAQYNLLVGTGSSYTSLPPGATVGTPLCSGGVSANPAYNTSPTVSSITISNAPMSGTDGVNKDYIGLVTGGFDFKNTTYASTTANLNATYANGALGVGATLTNAGTQAAFSTDGVSPALNSRILVQFQSNAAYDGIYTLTTVGDGSTNWVLTRATDYDTAAEIQQGDIVPVAYGTLYHDTLWLQTDAVTTVGTDPLNFNQFGGTAISTVQYNALVGGVSNSIASVAPSGTPGIPFVSTGSSTNPAFTTGVVSGGCTGATSFTAYAPICGGTTATGVLQSADTNISTAGYVLTSNGNASLPTWQANSAGSLSINTQIFTSSGTYTPTAGMIACIVECVGGGGGSGAASAPGAGLVTIAVGGGGGSYVRKAFTAGDVGVSTPVTVGAGGPINTGLSTGGTTSFLTLSAAGGRGGTSAQFDVTQVPWFSAAPQNSYSPPVDPTVVYILGQQATNAVVYTYSSISGVGNCIPSAGGASFLSTTNVSTAVNGNSNGGQAHGYGQGASGPIWFGTGGGYSGFVGGSGVCIITEYIMT
jgi:hypothetical protein